MMVLPDKMRSPMVEDRKIVRIALASILSLLMVSGVWFFNNENSPFYWYFLARPFVANLYRISQIGPYLIACTAPHALNMTIYLLISFGQWFILMYLLCMRLSRFHVWVISLALIVLCSSIGIAAWLATGASRDSANAQSTRFKELRFGMSKDEARKQFGRPDLETDRPTVTYYGTTYKWTELHALWGPTRDRVEELTSVRWIYFHQGANTFHEDEQRSQGIPGKWDTELGFDHEGKILWFNRIVGTTGPEIDPTRLKYPPL